MGAFSTSIKPWVDTALSFVFPDVCQLCTANRAKKRDGYVCETCRAKVWFIRAPFCERCGLPFEGEITGAFECTNCREMELHFASARSAVTASGPVLDAIHRYKYDGQIWFEEFLVELFIEGAGDWFREHPIDALLPVPLYPVKHRERGFNQAERLARRLGRAVNVPVRTDVLKRVMPTPTQTHLSRSQRAENMRHAFALEREEKFKGAKFVLIDDVFTTGATTSACAKLLVKAAAEPMIVWTVARAQFHG